MAAIHTLIPTRRDALIVTDVQVGFCPGGNLAVSGGDEIVPAINRLARKFENVVLTQDWHPRGHVSFASSHPGQKPYDRIRLRYGVQILWPDHCVQGTHDADFHADLSVPHAQLIVRKGWHKNVDSYSAFIEADGRTRTGLDGYLKERGIARVFLCGLTTDFCVAWSALDARRLGFRAAVIEDACRAIDTNGSLDEAWNRLRQTGVTRLRARDIA